MQVHFTHKQTALLKSPLTKYMWIPRFLGIPRDTSEVTLSLVDLNFIEIVGDCLKPNGIQRNYSRPVVHFKGKEFVGSFYNCSSLIMAWNY